MTRAPALEDAFGRTIGYLRVSVTARCGLECAYCRTGGSSRAPQPELDAGSVAFLVSCFAGLGVSRVRLTGGEPLLRSDLEEIAGRVARIPGVDDLALSTNGIGLASRARALRRAGLSRVNVSLDSLRPDRFRGITGRDGLGEVMAGIEAAVSAGLDPVKVNCVVMKGINDDEIADFAALPSRMRVHVRFIELMPAGNAGFFSAGRVVPLGEMMAAAAPLEPLPRTAWPRGGGPAMYHGKPGAIGTVGFIAALSAPFCGECNRVRMTSAGVLLPCLDGREEVDLGAAAARRDGKAVADAIRAAVAVKPGRHSMAGRAAAGASRAMCEIGG